MESKVTTKDIKVLGNSVQITREVIETFTETEVVQKKAQLMVQQANIKAQMQTVKKSLEENPERFDLISQLKSSKKMYDKAAEDIKECDDILAKLPSEIPTIE